MDEKARPTELQHSNPTEDDIISSTTKKDYDETYEIYKTQDVRDIDHEEARRVLRKIEWHIMPLLMGTYMLQYLDKSSINFAAVFGLEDGTHLQGQQYAWLSSIFYFGYLVSQYPAGYLLRTFIEYHSCLRRQMKTDVKSDTHNL